MRAIFSVMRLAALSLGLAFAASAAATEETQLVESINLYRSQSQSCAGQASLELPPLAMDSRLILSANGIGDLQQALAGRPIRWSMCKPSAFPDLATPRPR